VPALGYRNRDTPNRRSTANPKLIKRMRQRWTRRPIVARLAAHDLFIKMDTYFLAPDTPLRVPIINGTFLQSENSITPERVGDVSLVLDGHRTKLGLDGWTAETDTAYLDLRTSDAGTYLIGVSTIPSTLGLDGTESWMQRPGRSTPSTSRPSSRWATAVPVGWMWFWGTRPSWCPW